MTDTHYPPQWVHGVLALMRSIGWDIGQFAHEAERLLVAWGVAEGGNAKWNPLNTTYGPFPWGSHLHPGNTSGVQDYSQPVIGVAATALTLLTSHNGDNTLTYGGIAGFLQNPQITAEDAVRKYRGQFQLWGTNPQTILDVLEKTP